MVDPGLVIRILSGYSSSKSFLSPSAAIAIPTPTSIVACDADVNICMIMRVSQMVRIADLAEARVAGSEGSPTSVRVLSTTDSSSELSRPSQHNKGNNSKVLEV
jgi:hypothetical protein